MLRLFRQFLMLYVLVRACSWLLQDGSSGWLMASVVPLLLAVVASFSKTHAHWAPRIALPVVVYHVLFAFPGTANHVFLELYAVTALCVVGSEGRGDTLAVVAIRALATLVVFHSGLQKLSYGYYFQADFLAFMVGAQERFADVFALILPGDEVARLQSYDMFRTGDGPYRSTHLPFVVVSNVVWIAELVLPFLLWWRRTRIFAACATIALLVVIQVGAREVSFAILIVGMLSLFFAKTGWESSPWNAAKESAPWKRATIALVLIAAGVWPFVHRAMVPKYDLHPWRFGGWAMYATPTPPPVVAMFELKDGRLKLLDELRLPAQVRDALRVFRQDRNSLGSCARPDALAGAVFAHLPRIHNVGVVVQKMSLDRTSATMTSTKADYWYERVAFSHTGTHLDVDLLKTPPAVPKEPADGAP